MRTEFSVRIPSLLVSSWCTGCAERAAANPSAGANRGLSAGDRRSPRADFLNIAVPKALTATAYKLARVVYALMRHGVGYVKRSQEASAEHTRAKVEKQFRRRAKELGYEVKKVEPAAPTPTPPPVT
jgi:hypothetical protein